MNRPCLRLFSMRLTAISLALSLFTFSAGALAATASLPGDLPDSLKGLDIQDRYVPAGSFTRAGVVHALQGTLVVLHRADRQAFTASKGDPIHENDELFTLADSRCRIRLLSDDVVNMAPDTRFSLDQFLDQPDRGEKTSVFSMLKGKAVFYALRLFRYKETRFKVRRPRPLWAFEGPSSACMSSGWTRSRLEAAACRWPTGKTDASPPTWPKPARAALRPAGPSWPAGTGSST